MYFPDELVPLDDIEDLPAHSIKPTERELKSAGHIIKELSGSFHPKDYRDEYRDGFRAGYAEGFRGVMATRRDREQ